MLDNGSGAWRACPVIAYSEWKHAELFQAVAENGNAISIDADSKHAHGPGPLEVVLMALCSCTSVDVVSILKKKRQELTGLRVTAHAKQAESPPRVFTHIMLTYAVYGKVNRKAAEDAVSLSKNKYCSVSKMLEKAATIEYEIVFPEGKPGL